MLDIELVRSSPEAVRKDLERRGAAQKIKILDDLRKKDENWKAAKTEADKLRARRNSLGKEIAALKKEGRDIGAKLQEMKSIDERLPFLEKELPRLEAEIKSALMVLPNILHSSVPVGKDESENVEIKKVLVPPKFKFTPRGHEEIAIALDGLDIMRAAKISGARFYFLKNELVLLDMALQRYAVDSLLKKKFMLLEPPFMMRRAPYEGVAPLEDFEGVMYKIEGEDLYLIATSEHAMLASYMGEVILEKQLPILHAGVSACFRKEAGAHGKDTKGIFRVHQFNKVEQIVICKPQDSWKWHEVLLKNTEELVKGLKLPYRIVNVCTGDIGAMAAKKYDIEAWFPAQGKYREIASCSNVTDYQARRLNIRYGSPGLPKQPLVHTLNQTALATSRTIAAILENFQQADGSVKVPKALWKYMNGVKVLKPAEKIKETKAKKA